MVKKRILICPLDWGLGHATRCIPIIRELEKQGAEVIIGADNRPLALLKKEFPKIQYIIFPGYGIRYSRKIGVTLQVLLSLPKIILNIYREHRLLEKIIFEHQIDAVISDNRFGLWNKGIISIFLTHQIMIKCPSYAKIFEPLLYRLNKLCIKQYNACWIPDIEGENNLSGDLAHKYSLPSNARYIGVLSRFKAQSNTVDGILNTRSGNHRTYDLMVILSGPEPQRTIFENIIFKQLKELKNFRTLIVRGTLKHIKGTWLDDNTVVLSHLDLQAMQEAISSAKMIISRAGYSTIMDMAVLGKKAALVATPGQTEQEYLAELFKERNLFYAQSQKDFKLKRCLDEHINYSGMKIISDDNLLINAIRISFKLS